MGCLLRDIHDIKAHLLKGKKYYFFKAAKTRTSWREDEATETGHVAWPSRKAGVNVSVTTSATLVRIPV
jgi:hypothetical protein